MSLHSSDYIRDLVGHVPSAMLSLRQDEVSVFNRMNIQGRRRISLPSKLAGITEKDNSDGSDVRESLKKSYSQMKNKLDELEEYNQNLEKQLNCIFSSISSSVKKAEKPGNPLIQHTEKLKQIIIKEDSSDFNPSSQPDTNVRQDRNTIDTGGGGDEEEQRKLRLRTEEKLMIPKPSRREISRGNSEGENFSFDKYPSELDETSKIIQSNQELTNIAEEEEESNSSERSKDAFYEVKKHLILHLKEDTIKPMTTKKV